MSLKQKSSIVFPSLDRITEVEIKQIFSDLFKVIQSSLTDSYDDAKNNGVQKQNFDYEVEFLAGLKFKRTATAITYTALVTDCIIGVTSTAAARTINLPLAATAGAGKIYFIKDESGLAGTNNITIDASGAELIDGATTKVISTNYGTATIYCSGTAWFSI